MIRFINKNSIKPDIFKHFISLNKRLKVEYQNVNSTVNNKGEIEIKSI